MNNWKRISLTLALAACVFAATDAVAWGPRAKSVAAKTALRVIRRSYPDALKTRERDFEAELLEGTAKGIELFGDTVKLRDKAAVDNVIGAEIQPAHSVLGKCLCRQPAPCTGQFQSCFLEHVTLTCARSWARIPPRHHRR